MLLLFLLRELPFLSLPGLPRVVVRVVVVMDVDPTTSSNCSVKEERGEVGGDGARRCCINMAAARHKVCRNLDFGTWKTLFSEGGVCRTAKNSSTLVITLLLVSIIGVGCTRRAIATREAGTTRSILSGNKGSSSSAIARQLDLRCNEKQDCRDRWLCVSE